MIWNLLKYSGVEEASYILEVAKVTPSQSDIIFVVATPVELKVYIPTL